MVIESGSTRQSTAPSHPITPSQASVSVVILAYNEEKHIARAIDSVRPFASAVFVIDSYSTDRTVEIAEARGASVLRNRFVNNAKQFQWAQDHAPITTDWIMKLDADEVIEADLAARIRDELPRLPPDVVGVNLKRKHIFMGRWIRHGGRYPLILLRLWRRGHGRIEDRWMDEHIVVSGGRTVLWEGGFADVNLNDLTYFTDKHNKYATREAIDVLNQELKLFSAAGELSRENTSWQASLKRIVKERIYNRIPFQVAALGYFLFRYIVQLGFLDGKEGLIYHVLQGYWYRFLVGAKLVELRRGIAHSQDKDAIRAELSRLTGHDLSA